MNMADIIVKRRKEKGLTQKQLADKLEVTDKAVSKWERGNGYPDISYLEPLAAALDVTVSELLKGKTEHPDQDSEDEDDTIIKKTLDYANSVYETRRKNMPRIVLFSFLVLGLVGIITTSIVDFAINDGFTWAILPISSIIFSWLCLIPLFLFQKRGIDIALLLTSIFVFPFLSIIDHFTGGGWFSLVAVPMIIAGIVTLWLIRIVFAAKLSIWNKLATSSLIGATANIIIALIVGRILSDGGFDVWNLMSVAILTVLPSLLTVTGVSSAWIT